MRIYYSTDIDETSCIYECPFKDIRFHEETGCDCKVGSVTCQECKFCYGNKDGNLVGYPNSTIKQIAIRHNKYIKCSFPSYSFKYKVYNILFHMWNRLNKKIKRF